MCRTLADTGAGQMALEMQHGKQFLEPQFQVGGVIFRRRLDLSLKISDLSVIQKKALNYRVLIVISSCYLTIDLKFIPYFSPIFQAIIR